MLHAATYVTKPTPPPVRIDLSDDDLTAWRDQVLFGGAVAGDVDLNDAAVEAADAASPIEWQPEPHGFTGTAICVVIMLCTVAWFGFRIVTSTGAA